MLTNPLPSSTLTTICAPKVNASPIMLVGYSHMFALHANLSSLGNAGMTISGKIQEMYQSLTMETLAASLGKRINMYRHRKMLPIKKATPTACVVQSSPFCMCGTFTSSGNNSSQPVNT